MGNPYLSRNESIILATHRILNKSISSDMILTNQRLILVDSNNPQFLPETLPLTTIETVLYGESASREPEITLSVTAATGQGATVPMPLIFSERQGVSRISERDDWVIRLREQITLVRERGISVGGSGEYPGTVTEPAGEAYPAGGSPAGSLLFSGGPGEPPAEQASSHQSPPGLPEEAPPGMIPDQSPDQGSAQSGVQGEIPQDTAGGKSPLADRFHPAAPQSRVNQRSTIFAVAVIAVLIIALTGGIYLFANTLPGKTAVAPQPSPVPTASPVTTPTPTPAEVTVPPTAPGVTFTEPPVQQMPVPQTGVWVHVVYDGKFSGSVGTSGRFRDVTGTGESYFQIPAKDELVDATIQKLDGSGNPLTVEIYNNGVVAATKMTRVPKGTAEISTTV